MKKQNIIPIIVLGSISLIVALLLGVVNMITAPIIKEAEEQRVYDSFREVLDGKFEPIDPLPENAPESVGSMYLVTGDNDKILGRVVLVTVRGYSSEISMTVGVDVEGKITKAVVTSQGETHGKSGMENYTDEYTGKNAEEAATVDLFSGATVSSGAIRKGIIDAVNAAMGSSVSDGEDSGEADRGENSGEGSDAAKPDRVSPRGDGELLSLALGILEKSANLTDVTPSSNRPDDLMKLYKADTGEYIAYVVTPGAYVPVAAEAIFVIDENGDVSKFNILSWVVGHGVGAGNFNENFIGEDAWTVDGVELVSGATGTSADLRASVSEAMNYVRTLQSLTEKKLLDLMGRLVKGSEGFTPVALPENAPETLRALYRENGGLGHVAHIIVPGAYVAVATEALVYYDKVGVINNIELLTWNVGHGVGPGEFIEGFIGKNKTNVDGVELVSGATGTSSDFRSALTEIMNYVSGIDSDFETFLMLIMESLVSGADGFTSVSLSENAPQDLRALYKADTGEYIAYVATPGAYVPVAAEAIFVIDVNGDISAFNILSWTVGHGVGKGDLDQNFIGADAWTVDEVELVSGATGTSADLRASVSEAMNYVRTLQSPTEKKLYDLMGRLVKGSEGFTPVALPENAPKTLRALYKEDSGLGHVAHIIVPGAYVAVATEALVYYDHLGEIKNINLLTWNVGHGVSPGDFAKGFIGKSEKDLDKVELVSGATGTSSDFKDAVIEITPFVPVGFPVMRAVGIAVLSLALAVYIAYIVISKTKWRAKK